MTEEKLKALGIEIPAAPKPLASYIPAIKVGKFVFTSGQVPIKDGNIIYSGKVGINVSEDEAYKAAELCTINCLGAIKSLIGDLDKIKRIVKLTVFVNSAAGFTAQPKVANGASDLLVKIFNDEGKHVRSAVGVSELPLNSAVEIEMIVLVED